MPHAYGPCLDAGVYLRHCICLRCPALRLQPRPTSNTCACTAAQPSQYSARNRTRQHWTKRCSSHDKVRTRVCRHVAARSRKILRAGSHPRAGTFGEITREGCVHVYLTKCEQDSHKAGFYLSEEHGVKAVDIIARLGSRAKSFKGDYLARITRVDDGRAPLVVQAAHQAAAWRGAVGANGCAVALSVGACLGVWMQAHDQAYGRCQASVPTHGWQLVRLSLRPDGFC